MQPTIGLYRTFRLMVLNTLLPLSEMWSNLVLHNSVTDSCRIIKIGMWIGHVRHSIWNTVKVKSSEVKVTRSRIVAAQKHQIYPINVTQYWKCIYLIRNQGRRANRGSVFWPKRLTWPFRRMRSENMTNNRLIRRQCAAKILFPLEEISVVDGGSI